LQLIFLSHSILLYYFLCFHISPLLIPFFSYFVPKCYHMGRRPIPLSHSH
jgi:hypothetical protein